jgi:hypothetical protein
MLPPGLLALVLVVADQRGHRIEHNMPSSRGKNQLALPKPSITAEATILPFPISSRYQRRFCVAVSLRDPSIAGSEAKDTEKGGRRDDDCARALQERAWLVF